jgi:methyl-accepting chemotaxis protein
VRENSLRVENESLPCAILLDNMAFQTLKVLELLSYASMTHRQEEFNDAAAVVDSFKLNTAKFKEMYKGQRDTELLTSIDELEAVFDKYYEQGKEMAHVYYTEGIEEGNKLVADFHNAAKLLTTKLKQLQQREIEKTRTSVDGIIASAKRVKTVMFTLSGLAIALGLLITLYMTRSMTASVNHVLNGFKDIEEGDLTIRLKAESQDEMGELAKGFNTFSEKLQNVISQVAENMEELNSASGEMANVSTQMASSAQEMSSQSDTVAATTEEMSATINAMASAAEEMSVNVQSVSSTAEEMSENMNSVATSIEEMSTAINSVARSAKEGSDIAGKAMEMSDSATHTMNVLGEAAKEIGEVTGLIKRIAEQTNLLALNATIEAASAGDAGKGFAVVANEIKQLANQSAQAAEDIAKRIEGVQANTEEAVKVIGSISDIINKVNESSIVITKSVEQQTITANEISANVQQANAGVNNIASSVAEIANGANDVAKSAVEAAKGVNEVSSNIQGVSKAADESNTGVQQVSTSAGALAKMAAQIQQMIGKFKLQTG